MVKFKGDAWPVDLRPLFWHARPAVEYTGPLEIFKKGNSMVPNYYQDGSMHFYAVPNIIFHYPGCK